MKQEENNMSSLIDTIKALPDLTQLKPASADEIAEAEKKLGLSFANEYKEYLSEFGAILADGVELTGIAKSEHWSVVGLTLRERELALECGYDIPNNIYAVEDTGMDGIVIWQDSDGYIYVTAPEIVLSKIANSLDEYVKNALSDEEGIEILSLEELEEHIKSVYERIAFQATIDEVYKPLSTYFEDPDENPRDGGYCYSSWVGYYYRYYENGIFQSQKGIADLGTDLLEEIVFRVVKRDINMMASEYELKHRVKGKDPRRLLFKKELEYYSIMGTCYSDRYTLYISEILKEAPFDDTI
jgi:hypothetical protein